MASAYATIANGGIYMKPYIVDTVTYNDGKQLVYEPEPIRRVLKDSTAEIVTDMLVTSVDDGVAKNGGVE
jgi:penicillin-binding protein 1A